MKSDARLRIRNAIFAALPTETSAFGAIPDNRTVYVPPSHRKALRLECNLVIGARGVGKTFWSGALQSEPIRRMIDDAISPLSKAIVRTGFGEQPSIDEYPDRDTFTHLLEEGARPYDIWRAVMACWTGELLGKSLPRKTWGATVKWTKKNPETFSRMCERANRLFEEKDGYGVIVFDALDRSSSDWGTMDAIARDLLRFVLTLKGFSRLHGKVFLREDQYGRQIMNFPDASKLLATSAELSWELHDLHGLLWQRLCNASEEHGELLRTYYTALMERLFSKQRDTALKQEAGVWRLPDALKREGKEQRILFHALAGEWMGNGPRRGNTYTWTVSHLADGKRRTSPRSFLAAIRNAAEDTRDNRPDCTFPLHYESIKRGVQEASKVRITELAEDYPWTRAVMEPLRGLTVPLPFTDIENCWKRKFKTIDKMVDESSLPPEHLGQGWEGVRQDLVRLGVFETMRDGRVNMPDLFRVGFGLGRRGGVKPISRSSGE